MANLPGTSLTLVCIGTATSIAYFLQHTYKFDKWQCLVPRRKDWFRVLLTWMLLLCSVGLFAWATGWAVVKYQLGWVMVPGYGALPWPPQIFPEKYRRANIGLTISLNISYSLHTSLNAEEGLYWFHLMQAVRKPSSARSWLSSKHFYAWIVISFLSTFVQVSIGWLTPHYDLSNQLARELTTAGAIELIVLCCASTVLFRFPAFLRDVKTSGAGPEVRARLHFFHEANKVRTFFRIIFTAALLILGIDGLTKHLTINLTPIAADILAAICIGSYLLVLIISITLYLPRNYSRAPRAGQVMVGRNAPTANPLHAASGNALMSLLREAGQWDADDDIRAGLTQGEVGPFEQPRTWSLGSKNKLDQFDEEQYTQPIPTALEHFTSPFGAVEDESVRPAQIKIQVQREVRHD